jgi:hypothetical protein
MQEKRDETKRVLETEGGFNPDRPNRISTKTVGPLPTDDPKGKATSALKRELENEADKSKR